MDRAATIDREHDAVDEAGGRGAQEGADERIHVDSLRRQADGIIYVALRFGDMEIPDAPTALAELTPDHAEGELDLVGTTYFLSTIELRPGKGVEKDAGMAGWRKRLFIATPRT